MSTNDENIDPNKSATPETPTPATQTSETPAPTTPPAVTTEATAATPATTTTEPAAATAAPAAAGEAAPAEEIKPIVKRKTLSIIIHDAGVLRAAYMQFTKGGGLFIPTKKVFKMGEETNLVIRLLDDDEPYRVVAKVVWITPQNSPSNKAAGIGVEFAEDKNGERLRSRIEIILGPHLKSTEGTHTM